MTCHNYPEQPLLGLRVVAFTGIKASRSFRPALWQPFARDSLAATWSSYQPPLTRYLIH